jgi:hypothetical protein
MDNVQKHIFSKYGAWNCSIHFITSKYIFEILLSHYTQINLTLQYIYNAVCSAQDILGISWCRTLSLLLPSAQKYISFCITVSFNWFCFVLGGLFWRLQEIVAGFVGLNWNAEMLQLGGVEIAITELIVHMFMYL